MSKGIQTKNAILEQAANEASLIGITGLTIGSLADTTGMSKSGLFRHFGSKEQLQVETLDMGIERFKEVVVRPALKAPRGLARVRSLFQGWLAWATGHGFPGGCIFIAASAEIDDQPGPLRDFVVQTQREWLDLIDRTAALSVDAGEFRRDLDTRQFAHEFNSILLGFQQADRLMKDPRAAYRASAQFDRLIQDALA